MQKKAKKTKKLTKELLYDLFVREELHVNAIAQECDCSAQDVRIALKQHGLYEKREPLRDAFGRFIKQGQVLPPNVGENHPRFVNGHRSYRAIAERHHAKVCFHCHDTDELQVHHLDRDRTNNHFSNLRWVCRGCHMRIEHRDLLLRRDGRGRFIGKTKLT